MKEVLEIREQVLKVLGGTRTYVGEDLRDVSQPAVDPQQTAATETLQDTSPNLQVGLRISRLDLISSQFQVSR